MTVEQPALFGGTPVVLDAADGRRRADEGQTRAEWGRVALGRAMDDACRRACEAHAELCADQVWLALGAIPESKGAASAMGPAMKRAVRAHMMEPTGAYRLSARPVAHRKPLPVYRSRIYHGGGTP